MKLCAICESRSKEPGRRSCEIVQAFYEATNPVTRSTYRSILEARMTSSILSYATIDCGHPSLRSLLLANYPLSKPSPEIMSWAGLVEYVPDIDMGTG